MNIFYLDPDPQTCARYHTDKHVVKMILESAQILCTVINQKARQQVTPYVSTHANHPCVKWAGQSYENWLYVYCLMLHLEYEWNYRYEHDKDHHSVDLLFKHNIKGFAEKILLRNGLTVPALAMAEQYKQTDPVQSYRDYYNGEKRHLFSWTNREVPEWIRL